MASGKVARRTAVSDVAALLDSPEVAALIDALAPRGRGRKGFGPRTLVGACLVKALFALPTWTRVAALVAEHPGLQAVLGGSPSVWACYRFTVKLRENRPALADCIDRVTAALRVSLPEYGIDVAIDASDLPAFANGQQYVKKGGPLRERYSDPDASWGHRSAVSTRAAGSFYGFKIQAAICARTDLPIAWEVATARDHEASYALPLLDAVIAHGFTPETMTADKGYDTGPIHDGCEARDVRPIIPLKKTAAVKAGKHRPPTCEHGEWKFAGTDYERKLTKWRCPTGECAPFSKWVAASRLHPLIPRESERFGNLYRGRGAVEREFGRLKHDYGLAPLRVRGLAKVQLHADLTILARLAQALVRVQMGRLAA